MADDPWAIRLPNIRSLFLPDEGYAFVEADLARADAQVIAWEAGAKSLKRALQADEDIHSENADILYGHQFVGNHPRRIRDIVPRAMHSNGMSYRDNAKRFVHGTNFAGGYRTMASVIVLLEDHVKKAQHWWLHVKHPELGELHRRKLHELRSRKNPFVRNAFGFRRQYVGGEGVNYNDLLRQALAWIAQSTVAGVVNKAMLQVDCGRDIFGERRCGKCLCCEVPEAQLLLQIHDSILLQVPLDLLTQAFIDRFQLAMRVVVPYPDPLIIATEVKWSDRNWGHMVKWKGSTDAIAA